MAGDFFADVIVEFLGFFFFCGGLVGIDDEHGGDRVVVFVELGVFGEEVPNGEQQIFVLVSDAQFGGGDEVAVVASLNPLGMWIFGLDVDFAGGAGCVK